jgi:hypothetical protein
MPDFTEIIADDRESTSGIFEHLRSFSDVRLHIERLLTGDYIVDNTIVFERKAAADFAESLIERAYFVKQDGLRISPSAEHSSLRVALRIGANCAYGAKHCRALC